MRLLADVFALLVPQAKKKKGGKGGGKNDDFMTAMNALGGRKKGKLSPEWIDLQAMLREPAQLRARMRGCDALGAKGLAAVVTKSIKKIMESVNWLPRAYMIDGPAQTSVPIADADAYVKYLGHRRTMTGLH